MKKFLILILLIIVSCAAPKKCCSQNIDLKKTFKFSTFYAAVNGGNSISDVDIYSVTNGLETQTIKTPYDYAITLGIRKIARFGYENRANTFYDGTETSYSDAATIGKVRGLEFLFQADFRREQGEDYLDQHHFVRHVDDKYIVKVEYLEDGFADIKFFESSQRYRYKVDNKLSFNAGIVQRVAEPYGYDPLEEWVLENGDIHYTYLAIQEGYTIDVFNSEYYDPSGSLVATNPEVWEAVAIPEMLKNYTEKKRNELPIQWTHSWVAGFDYYKYTKNNWLHAWGSLMPLHYSDEDNQFSYYNFNEGQWKDYSGGVIFGYWFNKNIGIFAEGTYNKYWNRTWHSFSAGINYRVF